MIGTQDRFCHTYRSTESEVVNMYDESSRLLLYEVEQTISKCAANFDPYADLDSDSEVEDHTGAKGSRASTKKRKSSSMVRSTKVT